MRIISNTIDASDGAHVRFRSFLSAVGTIFALVLVPFISVIAQTTPNPTSPQIQTSIPTPPVPTTPAPNPPSIPALTPPLKITVTAPDKPLELLVGWKQTVTIQNVTNKSLTLKSVQWLIPPQLRATRATPKKDNANTGGQMWDENLLGDREDTLGAGQIAVYPLSMPSTADSGEWWFLNPTILTWHYRELAIPVLVTFKTSGQDGVAGSQTESIKVQWQTPFRTMVIGGILGALLAMSFYYLYLRLSVASKFFAERKASATPTEENQAKQELTSIVTGLRIALQLTAPEHRDLAWRQMLTASVTVIIVLLLLASGNQNILPISITVADFAGAAFLGLIAHKIGKVTFDAIFGEKPLPNSSQPPSLAVPILSGKWDAESQKARLTWAKQKDFNPTAYLIRGLESIADDPAKGTLIKEFDTADKLELLTSENLEKPGDEAIFVLVIKQADSKEVVSKPISIKRP